MGREIILLIKTLYELQYFLNFYILFRVPPNFAEEASEGGGLSREYILFMGQNPHVGVTSHTTNMAWYVWILHELCSWVDNSSIYNKSFLIAFNASNELMNYYFHKE